MGVWPSFILHQQKLKSIEITKNESIIQTKKPLEMGIDKISFKNWVLMKLPEDTFDWMSSDKRDCVIYQIEKNKKAKAKVESTLKHPNNAFK